MDFGLIDVNIPPATDREEEDEGHYSQHSNIQTARTLSLYIWDNYVEYDLLNS
jgi:Arb2-like domain